MGFNKSVIVAVTLISLIFIVISGLIFSMGNRYGVEVDPTYENIFNKYNETTEFFDTTQQIVQGGDLNPDGQADAVFPNAITAGKQAMQSGNLLVAFINEIPLIVAIPVTIISGIIFLIFMYGVFSFIKFVSDREP